MNRGSARLVAIAGMVLLGVVLVFLAPTDGPPATHKMPIGQYGGAVGAVAAHGDVAWLAAGTRLEAVDVRDPSAPRRTWHSASLGQPVTAIAVTDTLLLAAAGTDGLHLFGPERLTDAPLATLPTSWSVNDVALRNHVAFLAEGASGLRAVETSSPGILTPLGEVDTPGDALAVAVGHAAAFVADWGTGVQVVDVTDPAVMTVIAHIDTPGEAVDVALEGGILLIVDRVGGLLLFDVSAPEAPRGLGVLELPGRAETVATDGSVAYVGSPDGGLVAVDISNPERPRVAARLTDATAVVAVAVQESLDDGTLVLASDVGAAIQVGSSPNQDLWSRMHIWGVEGPPLVAQGLAGVHLARTGTLERVGLIDSPSLIEGGEGDEEHHVLYLADGHAGLLVVDVSDPTSPVLIRGIGTPGVAHDVARDGALLVVSAGPAGALVFDITDPRMPVALFEFDTPGEAMGTTVVDGVAFVADGPEGLIAFDLASQAELGSLPLPGIAWDVAPAGEDLVVVSDRVAGLFVVDVADPSRPSVVASLLAGAGDVLDTEVVDGRAWVAAGPAGVYLFDATDPRNMREIARGLLDDRAIGVVPSGDVVYIAAGRSGVAHLELEGDELVQRGAWVVGGAAERMIRLGEVLYVAAEIAGLQVLSLGD